LAPLRKIEHFIKKRSIQQLKRVAFWQLWKRRHSVNQITGMAAGPLRDVVIRSLFGALNGIALEREGKLERKVFSSVSSLTAIFAVFAD
jgi:hypothetical protein